MQGKSRFTLLLVVASLSMLILVSAGVPSSHAQVSKGSISGNVADPQGAAVPNAVVQAISKDTNQPFAGTTDNSGLFKLSLLPIGSYRLEISKDGFRKAVFDNVEVSVGSDHGMGTIKLEIGEITSTVEVSAAPPLLQSTEAQITNSFTSSDIQSFPQILGNEGLDNLALTVPGVTMSRDLGFSNSNGVDFSVNGLRGRNNDQQIDGQNNNDNSVAGPSLFVSDTEFVQEYQITTSNFGAEYGRNSGSVVNIVTKSGTNNVHGSVYASESNAALDSLSNIQKQFEGLTKVPWFNDEFVGGTIGGPLWVNHVFFFGGFDQEYIPGTAVLSSGSLTPTPAGITTLIGCFGDTTSLQALQKYGPFGVTGGSPIVLSPTTPTSGQLGFIAACPGVQYGGVQRVLGDPFKSYNFPLKLDIQTAKNHFYGRYLYNKSVSVNTDAFGTGASGYPVNVPALSQAYGFSWARTISTRMANEFRASYGRENVEFGGNGIGNTIPSQTSIGNALANISFSTSGLLGYGPATNAPQGRIVNTYQLQDNWTYIKGRHQLKAGANLTQQRSPNFFLPNGNGAWQFGDYGNYASNAPSKINIASGNPVLPFRETDTFLYIGDDFKVKNNLTLNLGLTWSYYGQPANLFHDITVKNQEGSNPLWNPALPTSVTEFPTIPAPKNSWGPNVGFAWTPGASGVIGKFLGNGKTVIRGGFREAYDPPFYNIYLNIASASPIVLLNTLTGASATANPLSSDPFGPANRKQLAPFLTTGVFDPRSFNETSITPNFGPQRVYSWSLGLQREIVPKAVFEIRYVGNHATNLFQTINGNPQIDGLSALYPNLVPSGLTPCSAANAAVPQAIGRVNCNEGIVRERTNTAYSDYNALQSEVRINNLWNQLTLKGTYTYSNTTDNASEIFSSFAGGVTSAFAQNYLNYTGQEHGTSGIDIPHTFSLTFSEQIPFFRSEHGIVGHILGGWVVSGNYLIASGQPYTAGQVALNCETGGGTCSANGPGNPYDASFNAAFTTVPDGGLRPFLGSASAPTSSVGIYAADICSVVTTGPATGSLCGNPTITPTTLVSLNGANNGLVGTTTDALGDVFADPTHPATIVTNKQVRFIANTATADSVFGTPFGNVGRNTLRDYWTNTGNFALFKNFKIKERVTLTWHMTMLNVFNHPNYNTIDPFIDDAGLTSLETGFANPTLQNGGNRVIKFGLAFRW
jgi:hypothetical protein